MRMDLYWVLLENGKSCQIHATDIIDAKNKVEEYLREQGAPRKVTGVQRVHTMTGIRLVKDVA